MVPSSTRIIAAAAVIGLLIEAIRKTLSRTIGRSLSYATVPRVSTATSSPLAAR